MKPLLTIEDVARILRVKPKRVYELDIPRYKAGKQVRFDEEDIKEWLEENKQKRVSLPDI